jgi:serine/threonine-protein kinase HipA
MLPANGLGFLTILLESGSDRIGALDFQASPSDYVTRATGRATLDELGEVATLVEAGEPLPPALDEALLQATLIGGARPKAVLDDDGRQFIAKFSSSSDSYPVVKAEFVAMELARRAGLEAAPVKITSALGKDVLLVERFDRHPDGTRRAMVSALTILGLDPHTEGWYATYPDLADQIRSRFTGPEGALRELFSRITFSVLVSNTDDHARNHAAFWDGSMLTLTPAYDLTPSRRSGGEATQAMAIGRDGYKMSQLVGCVQRASSFLLSELEAREIVDHQIDVIRTEWKGTCDEGRLTEIERESMWERQFINPFALYDY